MITQSLTVHIATEILWNFLHQEKERIDMERITIKTSDLKKSTSNVRAGHSKEDINMMRNSILEHGIINPPTVSKNGDGRYEIVAGQLRVAGAIAAGYVDIDCYDVTGESTEDHIGLSLSENFIRRNMTEIETFRAFDKLFKAGKSVDQIATEYSYTPEQVQRVLAIGGLPKKVLDAAENDEIGDRGLRALAVASKKDVARWCKLKKDERPRDWNIPEFLYSEGKFPVSAALFDLEAYDGGIITDLFNDDEQFFTDGAQFWELQKECVKADIAEFVRCGWTCKEVDHFSKYEHDKVAKKNGGIVFYSINERTGAVEYHKGYKRKQAAGAARAPKKEGEKQEKPDTSKAFDEFMAETRHAALQAFMCQNKQAGLVTTLLLLLKRCDNVNFRPGNKSLSDAYSDSLHGGNNFLYTDDAFHEMLDELKLKDGSTWDIELEDLGSKLMEYTPNQLVLWIITTMARNWDVVSPRNTDEIAKAVGMIEVSMWEADDAFWNGITNKKTLIAIAKETGVPIDVNATAKVIRAILKDKVPNSWRPDWLKF